MKRTTLYVLIAMALLLAISPVAYAQEGTGPDRSDPDRALPEPLANLKLSEPIVSEATMGLPLAKLDRGLLTAQGLQQVVVRLTAPSVAEYTEEATTLQQQESQFSRVKVQQKEFLNRAQGISRNIKVLGTARIALNAVMLEVDAADLAALAADPAVASIRPVINYELALSETVPYIGGAAVQGLGYDGSGVRVAVLDTGIDYYHANLGGSGDPADYTADDPTIVEPGTFPTAKVVDGFDFVGAVWPIGPLMPDPDPLDDGPGAGHGTHVADIIGGGGGVAPGADLLAVKVCSSVSSACSGVALIQAMDFALDPNGDGRLNDRVDVINMSLGATYGQAHDDDLSQAVENATKLNVLTVAAAGNGADKPFILASPSAAPSAVSVAQTNVPSAFLPFMQIVSPASIAGDYTAVFQPWSAPLTSVIEAPVQYGNGAGGNLNGCAPFAAGSLAGKIVLVDRGACFFTTKIFNIGNAGGLIGIIGLVAPGDPFAGGFADPGGPITIPGYMISQADSNTVKSQLSTGVIARFDPAAGVPLVMHMVGSSSRGPTMLTNIIKPEIGAPGASVSAIAGSGIGTGPFGGTSGATPMVTGSAALLLNAYPDRSPAEVKAVLVNTAEMDIMNSPAVLGGDVAAITRIGGGEVRVDRAVASPAAAWNPRTKSPALSFGFHDVTKKKVTMDMPVLVKNYTSNTLHYDVSSVFRFPDDAASSAVSVHAPSSITVPPYGTTQFDVEMTIDGTKLPAWNLNSGSLGASGDALTAMEFDGYLLFNDTKTTADDDDPLHMPWHVLPRVSGDVAVRRRVVPSNGSTLLGNRGVGTTTVESYSLIGSNGDLPEGGPGEQNPVPDFRHIGYATFPVPAGFCSADPSFVMAFAVNTWERQTHANAPAAFEFDLDTDQDGTFDYAVFNQDLSLGLSDGRNVTWVANLATGGLSAFFFTDHETNSGNTVLLFCGEQIGMNASNFFDPMDVQALAVDIYFQGAVTDFFTGITISPLGEQYLGIFDAGGVGFTMLPPNAQDTLTVLDFGPLTNNTETGLLLLYRNGAPAKNEAATVLVAP